MCCSAVHDTISLFFDMLKEKLNLFTIQAIGSHGREKKLLYSFINLYLIIIDNWPYRDYYSCV